MKRFSIGTKYEYCPNGNYWEDISGVFDDEFYLFCDCGKCKRKVYKLKPIDVTRKIKKDVIEKARRLNELDNLRSKINLENLNEVKNKLSDIKLV